MPQWGATEKSKILEGFRSHPVMKMNVESRGYDSENNVERGRSVEEGGEAMLHIYVEKENNVDNRILIQKHTKIKDVTWWILATDQNNHLLGLKKASIKKKVTIRMQIDLPENLQANPVQVFLMADSYVGLDQVQTVKFTVNQE